MTTITDILGRPSPGSLMRSAVISSRGVFRLARRDAELYSVMIMREQGSARVYDAEGNTLWYQPSVFTGSFVIMGHAVGGLYVHIHSLDERSTPTLSFNWREQDQEMI